MSGLYVDSPYVIVDTLAAITGPITVTGYNLAGTAGGTGAPTVAAGQTATSRRGSGEHLELSWASEAGAYAEIVFANPRDLSAYEYLGAWLQTDTAFSAGDYTVTLYDDAGALIGTVSMSAHDAAVWQRTQLDLYGLSLAQNVKTLRITDTAGDNDQMYLEYLDAYLYSNGKGPVKGFVTARRVNSGVLTQGMLAARVAGVQAVGEAANNSLLGAGVVISRSVGPGDEVQIQETGSLYYRGLGTTIAAGDPVSATATSKVADDDRTAGQGMGMWLETGGTTLADLLMVLGRYEAFTTHTHATDAQGGTLGVLAPTVAADLTPGIALTVKVVCTGAGPDFVVYAANAPRAFDVIDAWYVMTAAGDDNDTVVVKNGTDAITPTVDLSALSDQAVGRFATLNDAYQHVAANGSLKVTTADSASVTVYLTLLPIA